MIGKHGKLQQTNLRIDDWKKKTFNKYSISERAQNRIFVDHDFSLITYLTR